MIHLKFEIKIACTYLIIGALWILFSDKAVEYLSSNPETITSIQTYKGWFYVLMTAIMLFLLVKRHLAKMREKEEILSSKNIELLNYQRTIEEKGQEYFALYEEYKVQNSDLLQAKVKAEENDRLKTAFLQNISHEIRTPMNGIIGFSRMLSDGELSDEKRKHFTSIVISSSEQLLSIVNDILTVSLLETKQEKLSIGMVHVQSILKDLLAIFEQQAQQKSLFLHLYSELLDTQAVVYTDGTKLTQILTNLLSNAVKFTPSGGIVFGCKVKSTQLEFYVKDSGIGIDKDMQEAIFQFFRQSEVDLSRRYGGTGLGLSISKGFVELLQGQIWLESELEKGATFYFTIPYNPVES